MVTTLKKVIQKNSTIIIPLHLEEMNIGQVIQLLNYIELTSKDGKLSDTDIENLEEALVWLTNLTTNQIRRLQYTTMLQIQMALHNLAENVFKKYAEIILRKEFSHPLSFECHTSQTWEFEAAKIDKERTTFKIRKNITLNRLLKKATFFVAEDLLTEPAAVWVKLLDGYKRQIERLPENNSYQELAFIPKVLACIAWRKNESRYTKDINDNAVVDFERIQKYETIFLQAPATQAITAYAFFLHKNEISIIHRNSGTYLNRLRTLILNQLQSDKSMPSDGDGLDISTM